MCVKFCRITSERSKVDYVSVFRSKSDFLGTRASGLELSVEATIMHVHRRDTAMLITPRILRSNWAIVLV